MFAEITLSITWLVYSQESIAGGQWTDSDFQKCNSITITKTLTCGQLDEIQVEGVMLSYMMTADLQSSLPFLSKNICYQDYGMNWRYLHWKP